MINIEITDDQAEEVLRQELTNLLADGWLPPDIEEAVRVVLRWYSPPQGEE